MMDDTTRNDIIALVNSNRLTDLSIYLRQVANEDRDDASMIILFALMEVKASGAMMARNV